MREAIVEVDDLIIYRTDGVSTGGVRESVLLPLKSVKGELIRCKDCKHMVEHKGYGDLGESAYTCEGNMGGWIYPNSFCSNARRKEE